MRERGWRSAGSRTSKESPRTLAGLESVHLGEMLDWVADAVASRVEDDDKASPVWRERNVVYSYPDDWTLERVTHPEDLNHESRLMRNCAGIVPAFFEPLLSLRDPEGRPHLDIKLNLSGRVVEIAGKAQGPIKSAYAARLRTMFEGHRPYYAETEWSGEVNRFQSMIFLRDPWDGPDEFGVLDPRTRERSQHA